MSRSDLIPPSPDEGDYAQNQAGDGADSMQGSDPVTIFADWLGAARKSEPHDANAMTLATVDSDGLPDARMVLLKDFGADGFVFYTNAQSAKGRQLAADPRAALCFHWKSLRRQVRVRGAVSDVSDAEADAYFASRARDARIGAWASQQSDTVESREALKQAVAQAAEKFAGTDVPRPPYWNGFRLSPVQIEFWRDGKFRLHDRIEFRRDDAKNAWSRRRLYP